MDFLNDFLGRDGKTFREPAQLLVRDLEKIFRLIRPLILAVFQSLIQQQKAGFVPEQPFDAVLTASAEQKKRWLKWILLEMVFDQAGQPVDGFTHICMATGQIDVVCCDIPD